MDIKYYESHITIEPVFDARLEEFKQICEPFNFKVAKLLMQKDRKDVPERSSKDSFCTGHSKNYADLEGRMYGLAWVLQSCGFDVWRYKIEAVMLDQRMEHVKNGPDRKEAS